LDVKGKYLNGSFQHPGGKISYNSDFEGEILVKKGGDNYTNNEIAYHKTTASTSFTTATLTLYGYSFATKTRSVSKKLRLFDINR
jgi:hypothetical protein